MAELADIDQALAWHLGSNHFPPIPSAMIPVAKDAIEAASDDDWDREIDLRGIVEWRDQTTAPAYALVDHMHLDPWIR
jgi:hypothetical protein